MNKFEFGNVKPHKNRKDQTGTLNLLKETKKNIKVDLDG
uniref:Uncharacterized protein n=1 Tax=Rhizophora mucronata TaxID=61149 RepID=A0A2P2QJC3_RHIMU